jgi:purine nucleosidase
MPVVKNCFTMRKILFIVFMALCQVPLFGQNQAKPRYRVIIDNDFAGDPDGLFHLVHQLLCESTEIRAIIGSAHFPVFPTNPNVCDTSVSEARKILTLMGLQDKYPVFHGSNDKMTLTSPADCEGARAIIREALRTDTSLPLFILCGASLKTVASAYLIEPAIAKKITIIWIGGMEYDMDSKNVEYNENISIPAAQVIFNKSDIPVWQIPRDTYRQAIMSVAEIRTKIATQGKLGAYLCDKLFATIKMITPYLGNGDTYVLGDSPLVLLTALQTFFEPDVSSSHFILIKAPLITDQGFYKDNPEARLIRVFNTLDSRLMYDDLVAKLTLFNSAK